MVPVRDDAASGRCRSLRSRPRARARGPRHHTWTRPWMPWSSEAALRVLCATRLAQLGRRTLCLEKGEGAQRGVPSVRRGCDGCQRDLRRGSLERRGSQLNLARSSSGGRYRRTPSPSRHATGPCGLEDRREKHPHETLDGRRASLRFRHEHRALERRYDEPRDLVRVRRRDELAGRDRGAQAVSHRLLVLSESPRDSTANRLTVLARLGAEIAQQTALPTVVRLEVVDQSLEPTTKALKRRQCVVAERRGHCRVSRLDVACEDLQAEHLFRGKMIRERALWNPRGLDYVTHAGRAEPGRVDDAESLGEQLLLVRWLCHGVNMAVQRPMSRHAAGAAIQGLGWLAAQSSRISGSPESAPEGPPRLRPPLYLLAPSTSRSRSLGPLHDRRSPTLHGDEWTGKDVRPY